MFSPGIGELEARLEGYFKREWKLAAARKHDMADDKPFLGLALLGNWRVLICRSVNNDGNY